VAESQSNRLWGVVGLTIGSSQVTKPRRSQMDKMMRLLLMGTLTMGLMSPISTFAQDREQDRDDGGGAVFAMTNAVDRNEVIVFRRGADGTLREGDEFATGGRGSGGNTDPLESQGSLTLSENHSFLFAANAGSGEVSVFRVGRSKLRLVDKVNSGGSEPNAVAEHGNLVYVLNVGGSSNVVGFTLDDGKLTEIPGSTRFLTTNNSGGAALSFSPDGKFLAVAERLTNEIDVFGV
jgi:6-phosphogluconolactonase